MKKLLLSAFCVLGFFSSMLVKAQSFSVQADTVRATVSMGTTAVYDTIINNTDSTINLSWHVIATDFPNDWRTATALGICDANQCRPNSGGQLWNGSTGTTFTCAYNTNTHLFDLSLNFTGVSAGTHWITIQIVHPGIDTLRETYIINKFPEAVGAISNDDNIVLYPNPAHSEVNVVYNPNADIRNIAVYNIIGKVMSVYKVTSSSANLNLDNIPAGIYFLRMTNSHGDVVATRKFTKQ